MGNSQKKLKFLLLGLDNCGKTTLLYKMKLGEVTSPPIIGANIENYKYKNIEMVCWDLGSIRLRHIYQNFFENVNGIIYMIDATDSDNFHDSKENFYKILEDQQLNGIPVLIFSNKKDLPTKMKLENLINLYEFNEKLQKRDWKIFETNAIKCEGVYEGLKWISEIIIPENDYFSEFPLIFSFHNNDFDFIQKNVTKKNINYKFDNNKFSFLHLACDSPSPSYDIFKFLLDLGCDVNYLDYWGKSPFSKIVSKVENDLELCSLLVKN